MGQFDAALELSELNETVGKSDRRESYKLQIFHKANIKIQRLLILFNKSINIRRESITFR
jgi:hypothetical protein